MKNQNIGKKYFDGGRDSNVKKCHHVSKYSVGQQSATNEKEGIVR